MGLADLGPTPSPPWLLRAGTTFARLVGVVLLLPVACHPAGGGTVRFNGEVLPRSVVLTRVYPFLLVVGIGTLVVASGLRRGRRWSRPGMALWMVLWPILVLLLTASMGGVIRPLLLPLALTVLPAVATVLAYLYYNPAAARYFEGAAVRDAQDRVRAQRSEELEAWLRESKRRVGGP